MKKSAALLKKLDKSLQKAPPPPVVAVFSDSRVPAVDAAASDRPALRAKADKIIYGAVPWAGAGGLVPLRFISTVTVIAVQVKLVKDLSEIYGVKFSEHAVKSVVASLLGSGVTAVLAGGPIGASLLLVPGIGPALNFAAFPLLSAATTLAIGKLFAAHFESGGTLLKLDPKAFNAEFERELAAVGSGLKRAATDFAAELKP